MDDATLLAYQGMQTTAGILGSYASAVTGYHNNKRLMKLQAELNQAAIERQNEYNLPKNQMIRLDDAGLNPNLVYGNGSVVGNTSEAANVGLGHAESPKYEQVLMATNLALQKAQIANIEADTNLKKENAQTQESVRNRNNADAGYKTYLETWNYATWDLREQTISLQNAIHKRQYGLIGYYMANLQSTIDQRDQITEQTIKTMAQARDVQLQQLANDRENMEHQWKHWKNQDAIGYQNAKAMMISALAAQEQAEASKMNAGANVMNAQTQRKYYQIAEAKFNKMSDLEQAQLFQEVNNKIAYRENYLQYLAPFMEGRITLMGSQQNMNQQRTMNMQQQYDMYMPSMFMDFMKFGNNFDY